VQKPLQLTVDEQAILDGVLGPALQRALELQRQVGEFFGAERFVEVDSAHLMAEIECMGEAGLYWVEELAALGGQCRIPTTCNPRSVDFEQWRELGQDQREYELEVRLTTALRQLGVLVLDTCINYQTLYQPSFGQPVAWGDTGTVIWANSVLGARSNFEGGPVALAAGLTGRTPAYGYHLQEQRLGTALVELREQPGENSDWGALGCIVGRRFDDYWQVPVINGTTTRPTPDQLKQLGASLASYGSLAMFHLVGVTPEARSLDEAFGGRPPRERLVIAPGDLRRAYQSFVPEKEAVDLVVFSAPQLSVWELRDLAARLEGKQVHSNTTLLATTSYQNRSAADRLGYTEAIKRAGGRLLAGSCFYLLTPRELAERHGWRTIVTDSAKLANIIAGYGYNPVFRPTAVCIQAAVSGSIPW
jgi:predicted aconitase